MYWSANVWMICPMDTIVTPPAPIPRPSLKRYAWLSIAAAIVTIGLKTGAFLITGSVGLLSDALESLVNLAAALMALAMLTVAERPPDADHAYGHTKAEYFSSGFEGALILVAACTIAVTAFERLRNPVPLENVGIGLLVSAVASAINFGVARVLFQAGKRYGSITLEADAKHLMTDVWTTVGVLVGVAAVALTGWLRLDPLIALAVAANIVWSGVQLMRRSAMGLLDTAIPKAERDQITAILDQHAPQGVTYHSLRTRQAAQRRFISLHLLVPGEWPVQRAHDLSEADRAGNSRHLFGSHYRADAPGATWRIRCRWQTSRSIANRDNLMRYCASPSLPTGDILFGATPEMQCTFPRPGDHGADPVPQSCFVRRCLRDVRRPTPIHNGSRTVASQFAAQPITTGSTRPTRGTIWYSLPAKMQTKCRQRTSPIKLIQLKGFVWIPCTL